MSDDARNPPSKGSDSTGSASQLLLQLYDELKKLARSKLAHERPGLTLSATALVHEVYLRLEAEHRDQPWSSRRQLFAAAAEAMRRILVESARRKMSQKRGGGLNRQDLEIDQIEIRRPPDEILSLHEALEALEKHDSSMAELVKLRYFAGLTIQEAGEVLGISKRSVDRRWQFARAWLYQRIQQGDASE